MVWRCSPDACAPMAIATPKPFYHSSLVPMERSASQMPSPPGPPTSGIRPRTQEEPNIPPRLLAILMDIVNPVYSEVLIPRGLIGRLGVVLGCRALLLLHDEHGHPLFVTTHRGDRSVPDHRCDRACADLYPSLACSGKYHQRLLTAAGAGHQPWVCQGGRRKFGGDQTTNAPGAAAHQAQVMGTECRQTRGGSQSATGAAPHRLQSAQ